MGNRQNSREGAPAHFERPANIKRSYPDQHSYWTRLRQAYMRQATCLCSSRRVNSSVFACLVQGNFGLALERTDVLRSPLARVKRLLLWKPLCIPLRPVNNHVYEILHIQTAHTHTHTQTQTYILTFNMAGACAGQDFVASSSAGMAVKIPHCMYGSSFLNTTASQ